MFSAVVSREGEQVLRLGGITIRALAEDVPVGFAASELARYLPRLLPCAELEVHVGPPEPTLHAAGFPQVGSLEEESILVRGDGRRYAVTGGSSAAVLHAAYALLESLGARWVRPGLQGEVVRPMEGPPPRMSLCSVPAFQRRGLADGCLSWWPGSASFRSWLEEMRDLVDWMGKMRMNRLFVHFNRVPSGDLSPLLPELQRRGIALELGGHVLPRLLPAGVRDAEPELCRVRDGVRRADGNFCTANPRALRLLAEGARQYAGQLPPADLYHLWPYDAKDDPWCSCPDCRSLSGDEQMWRAVAAAREGLRAARPGARISGLLYHESLGAVDCAPEGANLLFAPRERCYLHPLDGDCPRNRRYLGHLVDALRRQGGSISVLEYYGDPILFGRPANRVRLVAADMAAYRDAGVQAVSTLVFGALSWWLFPVQLYCYARASWEPASAPAVAQDYCRSVAGDGGGGALARYYRLEDEAAGTHLRFCGYGLDGSWATLPFPPGYPSMEMREHLADLRMGLDRLLVAGRLLERMVGLDDACLLDALSAHRFESSFHRAVVMEMARSIGGWEGDPRKAFARALEAVEEAPQESLGVFGRDWLLPWLRRCREVGREAPM